jgi:hypothetical protein
VGGHEGTRDVSRLSSDELPACVPACQVVDRLLLSLNGVWRDRENRRLDKLRHKYEENLSELRRQVRRQGEREGDVARPDMGEYGRAGGELSDLRRRGLRGRYPATQEGEREPRAPKEGRERGCRW